MALYIDPRRSRPNTFGKGAQTPCFLSGLPHCSESLLRHVLLAELCESGDPAVPLVEGVGLAEHGVHVRESHEVSVVEQGSAAHRFQTETLGSRAPHERSDDSPLVSPLGLLLQTLLDGSHVLLVCGHAVHCPRVASLDVHVCLLDVMDEFGPSTLSRLADGLADDTVVVSAGEDGVLVEEVLDDAGEVHVYLSRWLSKE